MEDAEPANEPDADKAVDYEHDHNRIFRQTIPQTPVLTNYIEQRKREHEDTQDRGRRDEQDEEPIVANSDTLPDPRAVVIKPLYAIIANRAMRSSQRPVEHASLAVFDFYRVPVDQHIFDSRYPEAQGRTV